SNSATTEANSSDGGAASRSRRNHSFASSWRPGTQISTSTRVSSMSFTSGGSLQPEWIDVGELEGWIGVWGLFDPLGHALGQPLALPRAEHVGVETSGLGPGMEDEDERAARRGLQLGSHRAERA